MADFKKLIDNKAESAQYMIDGITDVIKTCGKRGPGSEGEKKSCEFMADVLKNDCGCERADVESFKEHPHSFLGWLNYTMTFALLGIVCFFFLPALGIALLGLGFVLMICQFVLYRKTFDFLFPEETGHNVTAIKKCTGEVKARIFFNGHPDAAWNWPVNNKFGGAIYELHIGSSFLGALLAFILCIIATAVLGSKGAAYMTEFSLDAYTAMYGEGLFWCGIAQLVFVPGLIGMYFMWDPKTTVDGANDNLTGCYMGIAILKAMKDAGIELEHTEVGVILSGSEEAGLRGAKASTTCPPGFIPTTPFTQASSSASTTATSTAPSRRTRKSAIRLWRARKSSAYIATRRGCPPSAARRILRRLHRADIRSRVLPRSTTCWKTTITL